MPSLGYDAFCSGSLFPSLTIGIPTKVVSTTKKHLSYVDYVIRLLLI